VIIAVNTRCASATAEPENLQPGSSPQIHHWVPEENTPAPLGAGAESLRNQPDKRQLHAARSQHGAGLGVLVPGWRLVEGVRVGEQWSVTAAQTFMGGIPDPLSACGFGIGHRLSPPG